VPMMLTVKEFEMLADTIAAMLGVIGMDELQRRIEEYDREIQFNAVGAGTETSAATGETEACEHVSSDVSDHVDLLYCIFLVAELFEDLLRAYPGLRADLQARLDELWATIDMLKTRWTGTGLPTETETV